MTDSASVWIVAMAALAAVAAVLVARRIRGSQGSIAVTGSRFAAPKRVLVSGWTADELQQILRQFRDMYEADHPAVAALRSRRLAGDDHEVEVPDRFSEQVFAYLVNYLSYPEGFDLDERDPAVVGIAGVSTTDNEFGAGPVYVYVPVDDQDYDLVYVRFESGQTYEESFQNHRWKRVEDDRMPPGVRRLISS